MQNLKISLLSAYNSDILGYIIKALMEHNIPIHSIIFDSKDINSKDKQIFQERTDGKLPILPLFKFEKLNLPFYFFESHNSILTEKYIKDSQIDLLVNAGTPRILKDYILKAAKIGAINCHPGLLPDFRGCTNVEWAIFLDKQIGNTVHLMTNVIDEGPIILQEPLTFSKIDRYADIRTKVYIRGFELLAKGIIKLMNSKHNIFMEEYNKNGKYFSVIEEEKMETIIEKLNNGQYSFQKD